MRHCENVEVQNHSDVDGSTQEIDRREMIRKTDSHFTPRQFRAKLAEITKEARDADTTLVHAVITRRTREEIAQLATLNHWSTSLTVRLLLEEAMSTRGKEASSTKV